MEQKVLLKVEGMDCAHCATTINRALTKEGLDDVNVDFMTGEVTFKQPRTELISSAVQSITRLGYQVKSRSDQKNDSDHIHHLNADHERTEWKFYISLFFTVPLLLHMFVDIPLLHNAFFQLIMCIPVMVIGIIYFGKSAYFSVKAGVPNMDVLIFTGSIAAFVYSVSGMIIYKDSGLAHNYLFFETAATIITLVLLGNLIEKRSVRQTTNAISQLQRLQPRTAKKIIRKNGNEEIIESNVEELIIGDVVLLNSGDKVPLDGKIIFGEGTFDESMLTGESQSSYKIINEKITGGTIVQDGNLRFVVEHTGNDTVLSRIIALVKAAQHSKPEIQKLGDRISAIFVPVVLGISVLTFIFSFLIADIPLSKSLMNSIAVLVISCPCAMGLATPTAVMVGLGRAARNGILIKGGDTVEQIAGLKTFVFDKTGTLTTGHFKIKKINAIAEEEIRIRAILNSIEKNSSHPLARALQKEFAGENLPSIEWKQVNEDKGIGMNATDVNGDLYSAGSFQMVKHFHDDLSHDIYLLKNNKLIATVDLEDEMKPSVAGVIKKLKESGKRVVLLSGDRKQKCESVAAHAGISEVYYEKLPAEKLEVLDRLMIEGPTAMVGDGINDAPALAKATVGISISNASEAAIQSAQVILLDSRDLQILMKAIRISEMTYKTIRQNLFWAFLYNVIAIPVAAAGFLSPMIGALSMAFSDVVVIGNSLRLRLREM